MKKLDTKNKSLLAEQRDHVPIDPSWKIAWMTVAVLGVLFCSALMQLMFQSPHNVDAHIAKDIAALQKIFTQIHKDCTIVQFEQDRNVIDFLTVEKFIGSQVGTMTILYPNLWKGSYLNHNPMMQQELYVIAKTATGYYIIPGNGVTLSNGQVLGKDIIIDKKTNLEKLLQDKKLFQSPQGQLVAKIPVGATLFQKMFAPTQDSKLYDIEA